MKKLLLFLIIFFFAFAGAFAQLSTRESDSIHFKIGTRPQAGNMAVFFGVGSQEIKKLKDENMDISGLPLICLKYYITNQLAARLVFKSYWDKQTLSGDLPANVTGLRKDNTVHSELFFTPGIEKHFGANNIFDIYLAAGIPIGYQKDAVDENTKFSTTGDYTDNAVTKSTLIYGFEGLIGLQIYLSFLPISVGIEAGTRGLGYANQRYKHEQTISVAGVSTSQTFYTTGNTVGTSYTQYSQLKYSKFTTDNEFRVVLCYYFRK